MKSPDHIAWFRRAWLSTQARFRVFGEYAALRQSTYLLSDIAQRGGVHQVQAPPCDLYRAGWNEGRRSLALEIIQMAGCDPRELIDVVERRSRNE
jgi:hypothetical protein